LTREPVDISVVLLGGLAQLLQRLQADKEAIAVLGTSCVGS
jgi:hypothetical protein